MSIKCLNLKEIIFIEYYSAIKNEISPSVMWMDLEGIVLSEICQTKKDKYHMIPLICRI